MATGVIKHNGSYSLQLGADSTNNLKQALRDHALSHIGEIAHVSFQATSGDFYTQLTNGSIFGVMVIASVGDSTDNGYPWFQIIGTNSIASEVYIISYRGGTWYLNKHAADGKDSSTYISSAVDLDTLIVDDASKIKRWRGDTCANLTHAPALANSAVPWELTTGAVGSNINYQYQEFRLYQSLADGSGSRIFRRQKYYYGANDFRWNNWVGVQSAYKLAATATGSNYASTQNIFSDYYVMVYYGNYVGVFTIPAGQLPSAQCYATCMLGENQGYAFIGYYLSNNMVYVRCAKFMFAGTDLTSNATTYVYAR